MVRGGVRATLPCERDVGVVAVAEDDGSLGAAANTDGMLIASGDWRPPDVLPGGAGATSR